MHPIKLDLLWHAWTSSNSGFSPWNFRTWRQRESFRFWYNSFVWNTDLVRAVDGDWFWSEIESMIILFQWVLIELLLCSGSQHSVCVGEVHGPIGSSFREINVELFATFWFFYNIRTGTDISTISRLNAESSIFGDRRRNFRTSLVFFFFAVFDPIPCHSFKHWTYSSLCFFAFGFFSHRHTTCRLLELGNWNEIHDLDGR